ncbi:hypothetical protein [uncultured Ruegeria sp.]|uniref:hypothetical protein n=1 Tax=uncultured Ruegeria sp. TaxID=259304 RepID=UPI0026049542|nr:hypothetical protein [uncultured Ruegeria sp.]
MAATQAHGVRRPLERRFGMLRNLISEVSDPFPDCSITHDNDTFGFVPDREACAAQANAESDAPRVGKEVMTSKDLGKTIERDTAGQIMNIVNSGIPGDAAQYSGQCIV